MATILVVSAHPDDAELSAGGTIAKLTQEGNTVILADCTRGELGTRGTPEIRAQEASKAATILGVKKREILDMPDGSITNTPNNVLRIVEIIREYRPALIITSPPVERHPDHEAVHKLVTAASFLAGLPKVQTSGSGREQLPHRPASIFCYRQQHELPTNVPVLVDISDTWPIKLHALKAYASQFHVPEAYQSSEPETLLSRPQFLDELEARNRYYGSRIGVAYAEPFMVVDSLRVPSLSVFV